MQLRDYQTTQLEWLNKHISYPDMFSKNISLQSPTGSGKSIVMLAAVKQYLSEHPYSRVFISTGFNELVYQFYDQAVEMGINTEILIGKANCTCVKRAKDIESDVVAFDKNMPSKYRCHRSECYGCEYRRSERCLYNYTLYNISCGGTLVITNHSTLILSNRIFSSFNGGFIDECQSFGDFYELALAIRIQYNELNALASAADRYGVGDNSLAIAVFRHQIANGTVTQKSLSNIMNIDCFDKREFELKSKFPRIIDELDKWNGIDKNADNVYVHPQIEDGEHIGIRVDRFFDKVSLSPNVCLVSATVDAYTKNIFRCKDSYNEDNYNIIDYSKSTFEIPGELYDDNVSGFISSQTAEHGLFLSTRLDVVEKYAGSTVSGYKFITRRDEFEDGKRQILIGSKSLFQGIDIGSIGFIIINRIPFPRYDESYKKKMRYFNNLGHGDFGYYTIPYTVNQLTQCMGRLWRSAGDYGNIALFDTRGASKHRNIVSESLQQRSGIRWKF